MPPTRKKHTANDVIMTHPATARRIVEHFAPNGFCLDPCAGENAFYNALPEPKARCEIRDGTDFFDFAKPVDWIISNPPYSIFDEFLAHAFSIAVNVVFFVPLAKAFRNDTMERMVDDYGQLKQLIYMGTGRQHGFPFGFSVGCIHYQRGYQGHAAIHKWYHHSAAPGRAP